MPDARRQHLKTLKDSDTGLHFVGKAAQAQFDLEAHGDIIHIEEATTRMCGGGSIQTTELSPVSLFVSEMMLRGVKR